LNIYAVFVFQPKISSPRFIYH